MVAHYEFSFFKHVLMGISYGGQSYKEWLQN